jgi:hypothetical protein
VPICCARIAGATLDPAVDVAVQQQLRAATLLWNVGSDSGVAGRRSVAAAHHYPWLLLASSAFGGVSTFNGGLVVAIGVIIDLGLIGNGRGLAKC